MTLITKKIIETTNGYPSDFEKPKPPPRAPLIKISTISFMRRNNADYFIPIAAHTTK